MSTQDQADDAWVAAKHKLDELKIEYATAFSARDRQALVLLGRLIDETEREVAIARRAKSKAADDAEREAAAARRAKAKADAEAEHDLAVARRAKAKADAEAEHEAAVARRAKAKADAERASANARQLKAKKAPAVVSVQQQMNATRSALPPTRSTSPPALLMTASRSTALTGDAFIDAVLDRFDLRTFFPTMDRDLIALACRPTKEVRFAFGTAAFSNAVADRLARRYHLLEEYMTFQTLEFYGDKVLYMIVGQVYMDFLGLNSSPHELTQLTAEMTKNVFLTSLSRNVGVCDLFPNTSGALNTHNVCSDSTEAIIGAVFYQYRAAGFERMVEWLSSLSPLDEAIVEKVWKLAADTLQVENDRLLPRQRVAVESTASPRQAVERVAEQFGARLSWSEGQGLLWLSMDLPSGRSVELGFGTEEEWRDEDDEFGPWASARQTLAAVERI